MSSRQHRWVLSGGLASGKSEVRRILEGRGFHTIDSDRVGHEVLRSDGAAFDEVKRRWPGVVESGEVSRRALAEIVFGDPKELSALEEVTHPHIFGIIDQRVKRLEGPVVVEVPVLEHSLGMGWRRIVVDCRDDVRLRRAVARGMSEDDARARLDSQPSRSQWLALANVVLPNHGNVDELEATTLRWIAAESV